jgi:hypothetical protein
MCAQEFLTKQLNGRTWSSYLEDEKTVIWSEIEKYGTENNMGLDEKKLRVINTLLIKISRRPSEKAPSHTQLFLDKGLIQ